MANIAAFMQLGMLNWALITPSTIRRPLGLFCGLTTDIPTSTSGTEVVDAGYSRGVPAFAGASLVAGLGQSYSTGFMTFGPFASSHLIQGMVLIDDLGNELFFAPLPSGRSVGPGDSLIIAGGAIKVTLV